MTTEQNQDPKPEQTEAPPVDESSTATVPKARLEVVERNASEWKAKATEAAQKLAQYEAAEKQAAESEALKRGEHEKLIAERDKRIAELESATKAAELRARRESARALLVGKGMVDPLAQDGALSRVQADGDFDAAAWVEKLAQDHPASFAAQKAPPKAGVSGTVAQSGAGASADDLLWSTDPAVRKKAQADWTKANMPAGTLG